MSYTAPTLRSTGDLITASIYNTDIINNIISMYAGAMSIASQAANDFLYASSATQLARLAAGTALQTPRINAAASAWEIAAPPFSLLKHGSGTDTNAAATTVDSIAISGLTVKDALYVVATLGSTTQLTAQPSMFNVTDAVSAGISSGNATAATFGQFVWLLSARQTNSKKIRVLLNSTNDTNNPFEVTFTTDWTGAWTLGLRHNGVVAGGTFDYRWSVYAMRGQ